MCRIAQQPTVTRGPPTAITWSSCGKRTTGLSTDACLSGDGWLAGRLLHGVAGRRDWQSDPVRTMDPDFHYEFCQRSSCRLSRSSHRQRAVAMQWSVASPSRESA
ncbi:hypothetical protein MANES_09G082308v8 [Manihot esculenta]|uniref:Uncharacterized protein n=1 Tax=Manihot esculenta TaxID=3983 RepID=A0ACB7H4R5_MANES|nr:hypothetical protein MANES_09G082308v8 [Manihot esculenta]